MTDSESEIVMKSALTKKKMKAPSSPTTDLLREAKKMTTKEMIVQTLTTLNSRKGASVYAIKKHITENFETNPERISYLIKKTLKIEVQKGTIIQVKGIGASGSFRLAPIKSLKKIKKPEKEKPKEKKMEKDTKKPAKVAKEKKPVKKMTEKTKSKELVDKKKSKEAPKKKATEKSAGKAVSKTLAAKKVTEKKEKTTKSKMASVKTPAKNRPGLLKRKSIGSIIKKPKMKPKSIKAK